MSKHTPGPWELTHADQPIGSQQYYIASRSGVIGYWKGHKDWHEDHHWLLTHEDAKLIAAAPDLLKALEDMTQMYADLVNSGDAGNWDCEKVKEVIAARAAIAKATKC